MWRISFFQGNSDPILVIHISLFFLNHHQDYCTVYDRNFSQWRLRKSSTFWTRSYASSIRNLGLLYSAHALASASACWVIAVFLTTFVWSKPSSLSCILTRFLRRVSSCSCYVLAKQNEKQTGKKRKMIHIQLEHDLCYYIGPISDSPFWTISTTA